MTTSGPRPAGTGGVCSQSQPAGSGLLLELYSMQPASAAIEVSGEKVTSRVSSQSGNGDDTPIPSTIEVVTAPAAEVLASSPDASQQLPWPSPSHSQSTPLGWTVPCRGFSASRLALKVFQCEVSSKGQTWSPSGPHSWRKWASSSRVSSRISAGIQNWKAALDQLSYSWLRWYQLKLPPGLMMPVPTRSGIAGHTLPSS